MKKWILKEELILKAMNKNKHYRGVQDNSTIYHNIWHISFEDNFYTRQVCKIIILFSTIHGILACQRTVLKCAK